MATRPYTEDDWDSEIAALFSERGRPRKCPQCRRSGFYGPREAEGSRRYRACKFCGFWQDVGGPPVTNQPTVHGCEQWPEVAGAAYIWWVRPDETTYTCPYCGAEVRVEEALITAPANDSSHPWWQVPQGMTLDEAAVFWASQGQSRVHL
jgi:hypothetical protein